MQPTPSKLQAPPKTYLLLTPSLHGLRFFAAVLVFFGHMGWALAGANGSLYFLVLSGYAVTRLMIREWSLTGKLDIQAFWVGRAKKLIPPFFVAMLITILIKLWIGAPINWEHALSMFVFVGNYYNAFFNHPTAGFSLYWTLSLLVQFYLLWPICFSYFMKKSKRTLALVTLLCICGPAILRAALIEQGPTIFPYIYNSFESRADALALGCLLGLSASQNLFERFRPWIAKTGAEPFLTLTLLFYLGSREDSFRLSWGLTLQSVFICLLIIQLILLKSHPAWKWLSTPAVVYLGSLSFLFYLFHGIGKSVGLHAPFGVLMQTGVGLLVTFLIAALLQPFFLKLSTPSGAPNAPANLT